ncbi:hypothetical protein Hanom_Chr17g01563161 [Helianthus anomalus]
MIKLEKKNQFIYKINSTCLKLVVPEYQNKINSKLRVIDLEKKKNENFHMKNSNKRNCTNPKWQYSYGQ